MYLKSAGGERHEELLLQSGSLDWEEHWPTDWSSKGIIFVRGKSRENVDIWILPLDGDRKPYPIVLEPGLESEARASSDGKWLAYAQRERNQSRPDVFVRSLSTTGAKWRVSITGGERPRWRADGKELFYQAVDGNLMSVPIESTAASPLTGVAKILFQTGGEVDGGGGPAFFDVSPDGQRFLLRYLDIDHRPTTASIVVVTNWPALLKRQ
jgi:hypothetical protein